ncbi:MAG: adenylate/guanylate cyclase domain-containing protein [Ramlibacter sp.]
MSACTACAARMARSHRFCAQCGAPRDVAADDEQDRTPALATRAPRRSRMLSERKQVTVLFVDLCDSTASVRNSDPEEARAYLEDALRLMTEAVEAYGGTVSQLLGDGLLALFGAPVAQEDHALRACLAAQAMHKAARLRSSPAPEPPVVLRVGLHSGEVIVGVAGQYFWSHYRADGTTIHIASRLEKLAAPGSVMLSAATHRLVAEQLDTRPLGPCTIRGVDEPMELFELLVGTEGSAAAPLARRQRWAPMVGRDEILHLLDALAKSTQSGKVHVVGLRGEAGIGKSRLLEEWCSSAAVEGFRVCTTKARGYASANSYGVIADLARALVVLDAAQPGAMEQHAAALHELLEGSSSDPAWLALSPAVRRRHIVEALQWLVGDRLRLGPLLLVLEDIFLADRESQRVLELLVPRLEGLPVLICVSYRQDFAHRWAESAWFVEHWLAPLREPDMRALAQSMLGNHESLAAVLDEAVDRAGGNPFFLEQLAITLIDEGAMVGTPGAYRLTRPQAEIRAPASVAANIGARVDRLPPEAKAALEAAAVLGDPITVDLIAGMQAVEPARADVLLRLCVASGLLAAPGKDMAGDGSTIFPFRHALVQEVVAATLTRARRKALHRRAFLTLQAHHGAGNAEAAPTLTRHAFDGEEWEQAATYAVKSMARAVSRSANREALRLFELGVDASRRVAVETQALRLELGLLLEAIGALMALGHIDAIFANLERANVIAGRLDDQRCHATVSLQTSVFLWMRGRYTQGLVFASQALEAGRLAQRRNLQLAARQSRMMMLHGLGRYQESAQEARQALQEFDRELREHQRPMTGWATTPIINLYSFYGSSLWRLGDYAAAQEVFDSAYALLQGFDHPYSRGLVDFTQAQMWIELGRLEPAEQMMRDGVESCAINDIPTLLPCIVSMLGSVLARSGRAAEAVALLEDAIRRRIYLAGGTYGELFVRLNLGVALRGAGNHAQAIEVGQQAVELALAGEQHGHAVEALFELAESCQHAGDADQARACLQRGLAQARLSHMAVYCDRMAQRLEQLEPEAAR